MWVVIRRSRSDDESGTILIMTAFLAVLVMIVGAMAVDLGNAMNRRQLTQNNADFAALAGGSGLPTTGATTTQLVADWLNKNKPASDGKEDCNPDEALPVTVGLLTDGKTINGEVTYPSANRIKVVAPASRVAYGLGKVVGIDEGCVSGTATARIASAGIGMTPYYATTACISGQQTLKDNSGGLSLPYTIPPLYPPVETDSNAAVLTNSLTSPSPAAIPLAVVGAPDGPSVTILGTNNRMNAAYIDQVGIFNSDQSAPKIATITAQTNNSITFTVPNSVASYNDVWYIRVHSKTGTSPAASANKWSARAEALPLQVGEGVLSCDAGSSSGNFGSLDIPWGGNDGDDLAKNIKVGLRPPTTLNKWPSATLPGDNQCQNMAGAGGITSSDTLSKENTNCLQTVTGLKAIDAYEGYLATGGRLITDTSPACTALGRPLRRTLGTGEKVNDDLLSCFLKNNTLKLSDAVATTTLDPLFTQDIWKSPRRRSCRSWTTTPTARSGCPSRTSFLASSATSPRARASRYQFRALRRRTVSSRRTPTSSAPSVSSSSTWRLCRHRRTGPSCRTTSAADRRSSA